MLCVSFLLESLSASILDFRNISALVFEECIPNIPEKCLEAVSAQKLEGNKVLKSIIC